MLKDFVALVAEIYIVLSVKPLPFADGRTVGWEIGLVSFLHASSLAWTMTWWLTVIVSPAYVCAAIATTSGIAVSRLS